MEILKNKLGPISNPEFNKLFLGQIFSHFADAIVQFLFVAILLQITDSACKSIAMTFFSFLLPQFLFSPFSGACCDKFSRVLILSLSCLFRAITVGVLIFSINSLSVFLIYVYSFILGCNAAFFYPGKMSAITNIVKSSQLKFANAINSSIGAIALLFGALGTNYLLNFGYKRAFLLFVLCI